MSGRIEREGQIHSTPSNPTPPDVILDDVKKLEDLFNQWTRHPSLQLCDELDRMLQKFNEDFEKSPDYGGVGRIVTTLYSSISQDITAFRHHELDQPHIYTNSGIYFGQLKAISFAVSHPGARLDQLDAIVVAGTFEYLAPLFLEKHKDPMVVVRLCLNIDICRANFIGLLDNHPNCLTDEQKTLLDHLTHISYDLEDHPTSSEIAKKFVHVCQEFLDSFYKLNT